MKGIHVIDKYGAKKYFSYFLIHIIITKHGITFILHTNLYAKI